MNFNSQDSTRFSPGGLRSIVLGTALAIVAGAASVPAVAETPGNILVIAQRIDDITSLDPAESFEFSGGEYVRNVYGKLVNFDPLNIEAGYQPDLAESWETSEDGMTITFTLREGVTFHSGNPVTAEDAEFSLRRAVQLNLTPSFILTQFGFTADNVEQTIVADGNTLSITTDKPYATSFVLNCLTATIGAIVDKKLLLENEQDGDFGNTWLKTNSAGSGPFKLVSWKPNESITIQSNPDYYAGEPPMKRVIVRHVQESATQRLLLERGDIDVARNLNPEDVVGLEGVEDVKVMDTLKGNLMYLSLNQSRNPDFTKPEVIEAMKYLVDYEGMETSFLNGQWKIHQSFLPVSYLGALEEKPFSLNIDKAKDLLAAAGVEGLEIEVGVREAQERIEIAQSLQNTFGQVGITLNITVGTAKQILARYRSRELDMYLGEWGPDYPDPQTNAGTFAYNPDNSLEAQATGLLTWRNGWDAGGLTEKVDAAVLESDTEARAELYLDIQREWQQTSPFAVLFQKNEQSGLRANVENFNLGGAITQIGYWVITK